jgi:hypothetical protein
MMDQQLQDKLRQIEERIKTSEGDSVVARWEFGRALVACQVGKQLLRGHLATVIKDNNISRSEIHRRMQLAKRFETEEEVSRAWATCHSWRRMSKALTKREAAPKPAWDEVINRRLNRIVDDAETEEQLKTLADLFKKALARVEVVR